MVSLLDPADFRSGVGWPCQYYLNTATASAS